jgi:hypothetical protein
MRGGLTRQPRNLESEGSQIVQRGSQFICPLQHQPRAVVAGGKEVATAERNGCRHCPIRTNPSLEIP